MATTQLVADVATGRPGRPMQKEPLWKMNDLKSKKHGQRGTIYWVGKAVLGEDKLPTSARATGTSYHGEWHGDKKHGYGLQTFPNGNKYEGQWEGGLRSGEGVLWVPVGASNKLRKLYVGSWKGDRRHGKGTCYFKSGEYFQGNWEEGKMHGHGQMRYASGDLYLGEWHHGLRSGQGTMNKANGDCYEGYWLHDKKEGSGSYFYAKSGKVFVGEWAEDLPKSGVYTQAHPNPEQAAEVPTTTKLPAVRLAQPMEVLEGALSAVRDARKGYRAKHTPVGRLFAEEELKSLQEAFDQQAGSPDAGLTLEGMQELCCSLGLEVPVDRIQKVCAECEIAADAKVTFDDFARAVAVLLDEEAMEASVSMEMAPGVDASFMDDHALMEGEEFSIEEGY